MEKSNSISKTKLSQVICSLLLFCFTYLGFGTAEIYLTNRNEFWFEYSEMLPLLITLGVGCVLIGTIVLMLLPPKVYVHVVTFIYLFSILTYIQGNFFHNDYGTLNGELIDWTQYTGRAIINSAVWLVVLIVGQLIVYKFKEKYIWIFQTIAVVIILTQVVTLVTVSLTSGNKSNIDNNTEAYLSAQGEFDISGTHNTIVFVLDCFDAQLFANLIEEYPELKNDFENFVFYRNTVGGATRTKYAIPYILTGDTNKEGVSYSDYVDNKSEDSVLYQELRRGDYDARLYTYNGYNSLKQTMAIDNIETGRVKATSKTGLTKTFLKLTAFRYAPHIFKKFFWIYSGEFSQWQGSVVGTHPYIVDDVAFFDTLYNEGLKISTDRNVLRFYHLEGAHGPYTMDENCKRVDGLTTEKQQALGALKIVRTYIEQLKQMDIYDTCDIFIMSDHGYSKYSKYEQNPLFMVKEYNKYGLFEESSIPLSYKTVPNELASSLKGELNMEDYRQKGSRYFYVGVEENNSTYMGEYITDGLAYDNDATSPTGVNYYMNSKGIEYKIGDKLYFGEKEGCTAKPYIVEGINYIESDYAWTDGHKVRLQFDMGKTKENLKISIKTIAVYDNFQRIKFIAGFNEVAFHISTSGEEISFIVPGKYVKEDGVLELSILLPDALSPAEAGVGVDGRTLGIAISDITIEETEEEFDYKAQFIGYEGNESVFEQMNN